MALGADWCNSARGFMFAVGCIQSLSCHTDTCPTGVATQDPRAPRALYVPDKAQRVANFHRATLHCLAELTAAAGLDHPNQFDLDLFRRRVSESSVDQLRRPVSRSGRRRVFARRARRAVARALGQGQRAKGFRLCGRDEVVALRLKPHIFG